MNHDVSSPRVRTVAPFLGLTFGISWGAWATALWPSAGDVADPRVLVLWNVALSGRRSPRSSCAQVNDAMSGSPARPRPGAGRRWRWRPGWSPSPSRPL